MTKTYPVNNWTMPHHLRRKLYNGRNHWRIEGGAAVSAPVPSIKMSGLE